METTAQTSPVIRIHPDHEDRLERATTVVIVLHEDADGVASAVDDDTIIASVGNARGWLTDKGAPTPELTDLVKPARAVFINLGDPRADVDTWDAFNELHTYVG